jgi:hypothetical protein
MTAQSLFPDNEPEPQAEPKARRGRAPSPKVPKPPPAGVPRCMEVYDRLFRAKYNDKPHIRGGKDGSHLKDLISLWGEDEVVRLLEAFFSTTDQRVRNSDYTIGAFYMLAQHLRLRSKSPVKDGRSQRTVDALNRAMGRE